VVVGVGRGAGGVVVAIGVDDGALVVVVTVSPTGSVVVAVGSVTGLCSCAGGDTGTADGRVKYRAIAMPPSAAMRARTIIPMIFFIE
jgi:hypothetical protein